MIIFAVVAVSTIILRIAVALLLVVLVFVVVVTRRIATTAAAVAICIIATITANSFSSTASCSVAGGAVAAEIVEVVPTTARRTKAVGTGWRRGIRCLFALRWGRGHGKGLGRDVSQRPRISSQP